MPDLVLEPNLSKRSVAVAVIQQRLSDAGFPTEVDGFFGPDTEAKVRGFRAARGLPDAAQVDGSVFAALSIEPKLFQLGLDHWPSLTGFRPSGEVQRSVNKRGTGWRVHKIENGWGPINLDLYPIRIRKLPKVNGSQWTATQLLNYIRLNTKVFIDPDLTEFEPYDTPKDSDLWKSDSPVGAVLHLNLGVFARAWNSSVSPDEASLVCSAAADDNWMFSTIWSSGDFDHPVSGNRQFGYAKQGSDFIFYTRAADRVTSLFLVTITFGGERIFKKGHDVWLSYQKRLASFVNSHEGIAEIPTSSTFSQRFDWEDFEGLLHDPTTEWVSHFRTPRMEQLLDRAQSQIASTGEVEFGEVLLNKPGTGQLLQRTLGSSSLKIAQASTLATDQTLTISGSAALLDDRPIPTDVIVRDDPDDGLVLRAEGRVPALTPQADAVASRFLNGQFRIPAALKRLRIKSIAVTSIPKSDSVTMEFADTGDTRVVDFLTLRQPRLSVLATDFSGAMQLTTHLQALLVVSRLPFHVSGQLGGDSDLKVVPASDVLPTTQQLLQEYLGELVSGIPDLPITDINLGGDFEAGTFLIGGRAAGEWSLTVGNGAVKLANLKFTVARGSGGVSGSLSGEMSIGSHGISVAADIPGDLVIEGQLPSVNVSEFVGDLIGNVLPQIPELPELILPDSRLRMTVAGGSPTLLLESYVDQLGPVAVVMANVNGGWEAAVAAVPSADWKFSDLSPVLAPMDRLQISAPSLILASFDADDFSLPEIGGRKLSAGIKKGVALNAELKLSGGGLDFVNDLIGVDSLPLRLATADSLAQSEFTAAFPGTRELIPGTLVLENTEVALTPRPFTVFFRSEATISVNGETLPRFRVAAGLSEGTQKVFFETAEPWVRPLGISGLTIRKVVLDLQTAPKPAYGVLGEIEIAGRVIRVAAQLIGNSISALVGELDGRLSLAEITRDTVGFTLPAVLDLSIEDFSLQIVANPLGVTIGSVYFEPGFSLRGTLGLLGMESLVNVRISQQAGVKAEGSLKKAVKIGRVFAVSDAAGDGPPFFRLDTGTSPLFQLSGKLTLLGLSETIEASVDRSGFQVRLDRNLGIGHYALDVRFRSIDEFSSTGTFDFLLRARITTEIGTIVLDTGCDGSLLIQMQNGSFLLNAQGGFIFAGTRLNCPTIRITAEPESLKDLPDTIRDRVISDTQEVFRAFLKDPGRWVQAIAAGAIREVENVGGILKDHFNQGADFIGRQLKTVLMQSSVQVAQALQGISEAPERIAEVLRDLGDPSANVREALGRIGVPAGEVSRIMAATFPDIPHLDHVVHTDAHGDTPLIPAIRQHTDTPLIPHVDQHSDTPLSVHVDQHTDTPLIPPIRQHADTPFIPPVSFHTDERAPHVVNWHNDWRRFGVHGDAHGDVPGSHLDTHTDRPAVGHIDSHTDRSGQGHADAHNDRAHRAHVDIHNDESGRGHADIHSDEPERGHVDAHSDTSHHVDAP